MRNNTLETMTKHLNIKYTMKNKIDKKSIIMITKDYLKIIDTEDYLKEKILKKEYAKEIDAYAKKNQYWYMTKKI